MSHPVSSHLDKPQAQTITWRNRVSNFHLLSHQMGNPVLPPQRLHPRVHHRAGASSQTLQRVHWAECQNDRPVHRRPGGSPRLDQGVIAACVFDTSVCGVSGATHYNTSISNTQGGGGGGGSRQMASEAQSLAVLSSIYCVLWLQNTSFKILPIHTQNSTIVCAIFEFHCIWLFTKKKLKAGYDFMVKCSYQGSLKALRLDWIQNTCFLFCFVCSLSLPA